ALHADRLSLRILDGNDRVLHPYHASILSNESHGGSARLADLFDRVVEAVFIVGMDSPREQAVVGVKLLSRVAVDLDAAWADVLVVPLRHTAVDVQNAAQLLHKGSDR